MAATFVTLMFCKQCSHPF